MASQDYEPERNADLLAAAQAAASWVRARRATWTDAPPGFDLVTTATESVTRRVVDRRATAPKPTPPAISRPPVLQPLTLERPVLEPPTIERPTLRPPTPGRPALQPLAFERPALEPLDPPARMRSPAPFEVVAPPRTAPSLGARLGTLARNHARWLAGGGIAAACAVVATVAWPHMQGTVAGLKAKAQTAVVAPKDVRPAPPPRPKTTGALHVTSTPAGAHVLVDGADRGLTPLTLDEVRPGRHLIVLKSDAGTVERRVTVTAGQAATIDESIFAGWVVVFAPFEVTVDENGQQLRPDDQNQIMLRPGAHELRITNRALAYQSTSTVDVKPGETTTVRIAPVPSTLTVTSSATADVWIDGTALGTTPINAAPVQVGTHEILVRRGFGDERRFTVTIGVNPYTLNADAR